MKYMLVLEGVLVGAIAGSISILYRLALEWSEKGLHAVLNYSRQHLWAAVIWFAALLGMAFLVSILLERRPMTVSYTHLAYDLGVDWREQCGANQGKRRSVGAHGVYGGGAFRH